MGAVNKIDSNYTGLRYAEEDSYKTVSGDEVWRPLEPNSYSDFGGGITTLARRPINASRQRKKGVVTDLDAGGGFQTDLTQANLQDILQGYFFADLRTKAELPVAVVDGTGEDYEPTSGGDGYDANDLLFAKDFDDAANNGLKTVVSGAAASVVVVEDLVTAAAQTGTISKVGHNFATGDAEIDASGTLPFLKTTTKNLTELDILPGEWIYIGGDATLHNFSDNAVNNGFKRVRSVAANAMYFDKSESTMVTDDGATEDIQIFFGRVLKNESDQTLIKRRSYQLERTLGAPDDASPAEIQAEYVVGAVPGECSFQINSADKVTAELSFQGADVEQIDGPTSLKGGTRPALTEEDAFNTSSDFARIKMAQVSDTDEAPTALFAYLMDLTLTINNNISRNNAVGVLGAFDVTAGLFEVGGSLTAYFADTDSVAAVRNNADITIDAHLVKDNKGISFDIPLITLGDGKPNVEQDAAITLPFSMEAASGAKAVAAMDHTMMMVFWDYLPDAAG
jgi:hypothetical protein